MKTNFGIIYNNMNNKKKTKNFFFLSTRVYDKMNLIVIFLHTFETTFVYFINSPEFLNI